MCNHLGHPTKEVSKAAHGGINYLGRQQAGYFGEHEVVDDQRSYWVVGSQGQGQVKGRGHGEDTLK